MLGLSAAVSARLSSAASTSTTPAWLSFPVMPFCKLQSQSAEPAPIVDGNEECDHVGTCAYQALKR